MQYSSSRRHVVNTSREWYSDPPVNQRHTRDNRIEAILWGFCARPFFECFGDKCRFRGGLHKLSTENVENQTDVLERMVWRHVANRSGKQLLCSNALCRICWKCSLKLRGISYSENALNMRWNIVNTLRKFWYGAIISKNSTRAIRSLGGKRRRTALTIKII